METAHISLPPELIEYWQHRLKVAEHAVEVAKRVLEGTVEIDTYVGNGQ